MISVYNIRQTLCLVNLYRSIRTIYTMKLSRPEGQNKNMEKILIPKPQLDINYLCNIDNKVEIELNINTRKGVGNINRVFDLHAKLQDKTIINDVKMSSLIEEFEEELKKIPNKSCPLLSEYGETPKLVKTIGKPNDFTFKPLEFTKLAANMHLLRTENLGPLMGHRSYILMGELSELEQALVEFTIAQLLQRNFQLISVPDILPCDVIESCGMSTKGDRTQVYVLDPALHGPGLCLSGTSEMAIAGFLADCTVPASELPLRFAAVSRCHRAETSSVAEERGIYRVHQFTKVEMFGVTDQESSQAMLHELLDIQERLFTLLGLHLRVLDMPPHELGAAAYRKFDVEAWMPGRAQFGEVSSCSDCTDYQARRLGIRYEAGGDSTTRHAHTVNGTACAVPRMLIALMETHQQPDGSVTLPEPLRPFMRGKLAIQKRDMTSNAKFIRSKHREKRK